MEQPHDGVIKAQRTDGTGPFVEITQVGRWTYSLSGVIDGIGIWSRMDGDRVWGRRRAQRRALKRLEQYRLEQQQRRDTIVVRDRQNDEAD
jgi:hypothetical protein